MDSVVKFMRLIESLEGEYFFYSHDLEGSYTYISPSIEKVLGYTVEEAYQGILKYMTDSELNKRTLDTLKKSAQGIKQKTFALELYTKEREIKVIEVTETPIYDENGEITSIEGVAHDITERTDFETLIKKQNEELQAKQEELEKTIEELKDKQNQLAHSEKMRALGDLIAGIAHEINTPVGAIQASIENLSTSLDSSIINLFRLFTKLSTDELGIFLKILRIIDAEQRQGRQYNKNELPRSLSSKEKRHYKKILQAKLEEANIGETQAITELLIYLNLHEKTDEIISLLDTEDPIFILKAVKNIYSVRKNAENIKLAANRVSKIIYALKRSSHKEQTEVKQKVDIIDSIETVLVLLQNQLKQGVEVDKIYGEVPLIDSSPDCLSQVWINLFSNAIHAMNHRGKLTINVQQAGNAVQIQVSDTGHGIPEDKREKIFEPFFTTKKAGEGIGIGLDVVKNIIQKHQGTLELESQIDVGTTFTITLPIE